MYALYLLLPDLQYKLTYKNADIKRCDVILLLTLKRYLHLQTELVSIVAASALL
jgi:hypothetical protein